MTDNQIKTLWYAYYDMRSVFADIRDQYVESQNARKLDTILGKLENLILENSGRQ